MIRERLTKKAAELSFRQLLEMLYNNTHSKQQAEQKAA